MNPIEAYRRHHRVSQWELARRLGVTQSTLSRWEASAPPRIAWAAIEAATDGAVPVSAWVRPSDEEAAA